MPERLNNKVIIPMKSKTDVANDLAGYRFATNTSEKISSFSRATFDLDRRKQVVKIIKLPFPRQW
jgi:hypothetical protein